MGYMHTNIYTTVPLPYIKCNGYDFMTLVNKGFCGFYSKDPTTKRIWWDCHVTKTLRFSSKLAQHQNTQVLFRQITFSPGSLLLGLHLPWKAQQKQDVKKQMFCNIFEQGALLGGFKDLSFLHLGKWCKWANSLDLKNSRGVLLGTEANKFARSIILYICVHHMNV